MKCPHCQTENENNAKVCVNCGAQLAPETAQTLKAATTAGFAIGKSGREARLKEVVDPSAIISDRAYNGIIGAMLVWGLLINYILCVKVGSYTNIFPNMSPLAFCICYVVVALIGIAITAKAQNPVVSFIGFNVVVIPLGIVISTLVETYGGVSSTPVIQAFLYTIIISVAMVATAIVFPKFFEKIGPAIIVILLALVLCEVILLIFGVQQIWTSWIAAVLFSFFLGYDVYRSQQFPKTVKNAILSAMDMYMDIANLFIRLLEIFGKSDK